MSDTTGPEPQSQRTPRWARRKPAAKYANVGETKFNELMMAKKITAKKDGKMVIVDLNSIDDYYTGLPDVAETRGA